MNLFKSSVINKKVCLLLLVCCFAVLKLQAQLGFCSGNSGDPIFTENFGTGVTNNSLSPGTTTYTYNSGIPNNGQYTVSNNTIANGLDWHQLNQDHTIGDTNGKFLIIQADINPGEFYKRTVTGLCETTTYEFSAWVMNLVIANSFCSRVPGGTIPVNVRFEIWDSTNTILIKSGNTGNIVETSNPIWNEYGLVFQTLAGQTSVILKMINNGQGGCGNDLAIDDIEFKTCGDLITISDSFNNNAISLCSSQTPLSTTLTANPDAAVYSSHFYQWQESLDGLVWVDLVGATNQNLPISITTTKYYRTKVAEVAVNLNNTQCIALSNVYQTTVAQAPPAPILQCWEFSAFNVSTCSWDITGTQPVQPPTQCWEMATFNNTTCVWDITGTQPIQPAISCWQSVTFNTTTCSWDITGTQPVLPVTQCWETSAFNNTSCSWEITGAQPTQPATACWEIATFNNTTCVWDVTGTQPVQPSISCWQSLAFNTTTCVWEVTGTQPIRPNTQCWETATFNTSTCSWTVIGTQPIQPIAVNCWDNYQFNIGTCSWENLGTQPGNVYTENLVFCNGETPRLEANASIPAPTYLWSTGSTDDFITVNAPGTYSVEISSPACFFETRNFNVTQSPIPIIDDVSSEGTNIVVTISNSGDFIYYLDGNIYQNSNIL